MADESVIEDSPGKLTDDEIKTEDISLEMDEQPSTSNVVHHALASHSRKKVKLKDEKLCGVCGDKALGYNFNAITCESCKAFFRRNALKDKSMTCLFEKKCVVDIRTRRFCPACRIKKCYSIGMNRDMILDDSERKKRMGKVIANRARKDSASSNNSSPFLVQIKSETSSADNSVSSPPSADTMEQPTAQYGRHRADPDIIFKHVPPEVMPCDRNMYLELSHTDSQLLNSITLAYHSTLGAMPGIGPHSEEKEYQKAADLINHSELVIRKLIVFVKHLEDFRCLNQEDQIAALKACVMNTLLLRSALFYSIEKDAWITPKGEIPTSILKQTTGFVSLHNSHVYYCQRVKSMAQSDYHIYALLQALIIFDPSGDNISDRSFVSSLHDRYLILLKHYLENRFSYEYAKDYFVSVMDRLCDLRSIGEEHAKILLQVNPVDVEPLMLEVLNLK